MAVHRSKALLLPSGLLILTVFVGGCAHLPQLRESFDDSLSALMNIFPSGEGESTKPVKENSSERLARLTQENAKLQADLEAAEAALVEAELRLSGSHTRADAVSTLAMTRIQVERAMSLAPWRADEIKVARTKLDEAARQVEENRFGAALFFVSRARRVAESILAETDDGEVGLIGVQRVNLRAGPSTRESILSVLSFGTQVLLQGVEGEWVLVQVSEGPVGWIHRRFVNTQSSTRNEGPAAPLP